MLAHEMQEALNKQINAEFYSAWLYLSMSAWFAEQGLPGFAGWMQAQFREEQDHGLKIIHYMHERGGNVELKSIGAVPTTWKSPADVFAQTLEHEKTVTGCFESIMDLAVSSKDYATQAFLSWFITEQVEEESTAAGILGSLRAVEDNQIMLRMIDKELSARK